MAITTGASAFDDAVGGATASVSLAGITDGHLMVLLIEVNQGGGIPSLPAGWTSRATATNGTMNYRVCSKPKVTGDLTVVCGGGGLSSTMALIQAYGNAVWGQISAAALPAGSVANFDPPALTITDAGSRSVIVAGGSAIRTVTAWPAPWVDRAHSTGGGGPTIFVGDATPGVGLQDPGLVTLSGVTNLRASWQVELVPAAPPGPANMVMHAAAQSTVSLAIGQLNRWRARYHSYLQGIGTARIAVVGDSQSEGYNSGVLGHALNMMTTSASFHLAARRGDAEAGIYLPTYISNGWPEGVDQWDRSSGPNPWEDKGGLGDRTCQYLPGNRLETVAPAWATHVMVHSRNTGAASDVVEVKSNGTLIGTITYASGDSGDHVTAPMALVGSGNLLRITMTVGLSSTYVHGVTWLNSATNYLAVMEGGHGGYASGDFAVGSPNRRLEAVAATDPDLVIMNMGGIDLFLGVTKAALKANMLSIVAQIDALMPGDEPDYLFVVNPYTNPFRATGITISEATFNAYLVAANQEVSDSLGARSRCLNTGTLFGPFDPSVGVEDVYWDGHLWTSRPDVVDGIAGDWAHMTAYGHNRMGEAVADALADIPAVPVTMSAAAHSSALLTVNTPTSAPNVTPHAAAHSTATLVLTTGAPVAYVGDGQVVGWYIGTEPVSSEGWLP